MAYDSFPHAESDELSDSSFIGASVQSSVINIVNTIVGAGILAMPFAYKSNGVLLGTLIILLSGLSAGLGLFLQAISSRFVSKGHASFFSLSKITYPSLAVLFDIAIAIKCFGVGVSYIIIVGDLMPQIIESIGGPSGFLLDRRFWVLVSFSIVGPLSFLRRLDSLKYTSIIALASVGYLVVVVVVHFLIGDTISNRGTVHWIKPEGTSAILSSLPVIVFAFTCHQNMYSILNELGVSSDLNFAKIIGTSIGTSGFFYVLVGFCGYMSFGNNVGGNIISMYPYSVFSTIGRIAIVVLVVFSYPLQCHPCRASLNHIIHWIEENYKKNHHESGSSDALLATQNLDDDPDASIATVATAATAATVQSSSGAAHAVALSNTRFIILTSVILILSIITSISVKSLELMLAFVGSTGSTSISFILPGVFGYSLLGSSDAAAITGYKSSTIRMLQNASVVLAAWGVLVMVVCLSTNIWLHWG